MEDYLNQFEAIVERYHAQVYRLAYKFTQNKADAEDIAQNTFLRAYEFIRKNPDRELNLKPWLMTICVNLCRNLAKKKKNLNFSNFDKEEEGLMFVDTVKDKGPSPKEKAKKKETQATVQKALKRLAPKYRLILELRFVQDLSYKEIAEVLSLPLNTVKVHINRAKKQLTAYL